MRSCCTAPSPTGTPSGCWPRRRGGGWSGCCPARPPTRLGGRSSRPCGGRRARRRASSCSAGPTRRRAQKPSPFAGTRRRRSARRRCQPSTTGRRGVVGRGAPVEPATAMTADLPARRTADAGAARSVGGIAAVGQDLAELRTARTEVSTWAVRSFARPGRRTHPPLLGVETAAGRDLSRLPEPRRGARRMVAAPAGDWIPAWGVDPTCSPAGRSTARDDVVPSPRGAVLRRAPELASAEALRLAVVAGRRGLRASWWTRAAGPPASCSRRRRSAARVDVPRRRHTTMRPARRAARQMAASGLTGGHVMDLEDGDLRSWRELDEAAAPAAAARPVGAARRRRCPQRHLVALQREQGRVWRVDAVKLFIDGTVDAGTAWLDEADRCGAVHPAYWPDPGEYSRAVRSSRRRGCRPRPTRSAMPPSATSWTRWQRGTTDDRAASHRAPRDAVRRSRPPHGRSRAHASMQPTHATDYTRADGSDNWSTRLGPERARRGWRCADLVRAGVNLVLGSDWPVAPSTLGASWRRPRSGVLPGGPTSDPLSLRRD